MTSAPDDEQLRDGSRAEDVSGESPKDDLFIEAVYRTDETDPDLNDNQLALAIPGPVSDEVVYKALRRLPKPRPEGFESWPLEQRLERIYTPFFFAFRHQITALHAVVRLVRRSLVSRNPSNPAVMRALLSNAAGRAARATRQSTTGGGAGLGMVVVGASGVGKTSFTDRVGAYLKTSWVQIGVVRVIVQSTWKQTLLEILREIDRQLGREYLEPRHRSSSQSSLVSSVSSALPLQMGACLLVSGTAAEEGARPSPNCVENSGWRR
jgi:hypothetical protein